MKRAVAWLLILILLAMSGPAQAMMAYNYLTRPTLEGSSISKKWPQTQVWQGFCKGRPPSPEYGFNQVGQRIAGQQIDANGTEKRAYGYNNRRELIASSVDGPRGQHSGIQYALDQNDNITNNNGVGFTSNVADQLTKAGSTALGYNGAGQATTWGDKSLTFSYKDQIKAITGPGLNAQYLYDGNGQRVQKTVNGVVQRFLWNGGSIAKEYRADGSVRADYQLGVGAKIEGKWQFYLSDIQGSTIGIADDQGKVIAQYSFSDYGVTTQTSGDKSLYQPFLYTHSELDAETGLYHNKARHYAPGLGKFLARDPIANSNLYSYCNGDPINGMDPDGLQDDGTKSDWQMFVAMIRGTFNSERLSQFGQSLLEAIGLLESPGTKAEQYLVGQALDHVHVNSGGGGDSRPTDIVIIFASGGAAKAAKKLAKSQYKGCKNPSFNWPHILDSHQVGGKNLQAGARKSVFGGLTDQQLQGVVEKAWQGRSYQSTGGGGRQLFQGYANGFIVGFWYNPVTKTVESAWPIP